MFLTAGFSSLLLSVTGVLGAANRLVQVTNFGDNPTDVGMFVYTPNELAHPTPLIVAIHYCTGSAQAYFTGTKYADLADSHGFIVIYPNSPAGTGGCWDVHTNATLIHNAGGDSLGIASQVRYAIANYDVDPSLVFATGTSSGAMMTSVLMGAYPDIFAAGSAFSGVPYGCFKGPDLWNSQCADGDLSMTPQQWSELVFSGYPGYDGPRPKVQIWHGTNDTILYSHNFWEGIKQWTSIFDYPPIPITNITDDPLPGYSNATYGPQFNAILAQNVGHTVPERENDVLSWFGLSNITPGGSSSPTSGVPSSHPRSPQPRSPSPAQRWDQCGGIAWTGATVCANGFTCTHFNAYYSQCL